MKSKNHRHAARTALALFALSLAGAILAAPSLAQRAEPRSEAPVIPVYKRATAPVEQRVADLLARMTLEEKLAQLQGSAIQPTENVAAQRPALGRSRLGIPILFHGQGSQGEGRDLTAFPQPIALASSWDPQLVRDVHAVAAKELRARGALLYIGPSLDVVRDPRRGSVARSFGEDPYLVSELGVAAIEGAQDRAEGRGAPRARTLVAVGHLAGHGPADERSEVGPAPLAERELREVFFPPFEQALKRTGVNAIVAARNEIDGIPSHASKWLLQDVLRGEWAFGGAVLAGTGAIAELQDVYRVAGTRAQATLLALEAGVDTDFMASPDPGVIAEAIRTGRIPLSRIDAAVGRVLALKFRAGLFEHPYPEPAAARPSPDQALALRAAQRSITLLENDGTLPLRLPAPSSSRPRIAVIELGVAQSSILEGIRAKARGRADLIAMGEKVAALDAVARADWIVLVLGKAGATEQVPLLASLRNLGKPVVVVLAGDRPFASLAISEQANALLGAWCLGEQGGKAVADVLFGDVNPGGKLPVTLARNTGQLPIFYDAKPSARRGYLFDSSEPLYPFGWGLGYSTFELGAPRLSAASMGVDGTVQVSVDVRNSGAVMGDETVQLYVRGKVSSVTRPVKQLKGFRRVSLAPGEKRTLTFTLAARELAIWDERMRRVVEPGEFDIMTGAHSAQLQSVALTVLEGARK